MKYFLAIVLAAFLATLTSCLTIEENYTFKSNGSGTMEYKIDMSEMASLLKMASEEGENPMEEEIDFTEMADRLQGIKGISDVAAVQDKENYLFSVSYKFENIDALNTAMNALLSPSGEVGETEHTFFTQNGKTLIRVHRMNEELNPEELLGEEDESTSEYAMTLMESMKYRLNFKFSKRVKTVTSSSEVTFEDEKKHKAFTIETDFKTLMEDNKALDTRMVLK